jgi:hypothetical protein
MKLPKFVQKTQSAPPVRMFDDRPAPSMASSHDRPRGSVGRVDVKFAARLPEAAQRTMRDLADEADEMNVMSHALHERREKIREAMGNAEARISQMRSRLNSYRNNSEPAIEDQRKIIAECRADLDRLDARMAQLGAKARVLSQLIEGAGDLVRRVDREKPIMLFSGASPAPRKGEDAADAVEARRRRLRELEADFSRTTVAPKLSADMKAQEVARIEFLAKQGAPSAFATIEQGREVIWPTTSAELNGQSGSATIPDILAIIAPFMPRPDDRRRRARDRFDGG